MTNNQIAITYYGVETIIKEYNEEMEKIKKDYTQINKKYTKYLLLDKNANSFLIKKNSSYDIEVNDCLHLNIGGSYFTISTDLIKKKPKCLFSEILNSINDNIDNTIIFIDRSSRLFRYILLYFYNSNDQIVNVLTQEDEPYLIKDLLFYEMVDFINYLIENSGIVRVISWEHSYPFYCCIRNEPSSIHEREDRSNKGMAVTGPAYLILELESKVECEEIEIAGFYLPKVWNSKNGAGAQIYGSINKEDWTLIGTIPQNFSEEIIRVPLKKMIFKYIQFKNSNYLGIGFFSAIQTKQKLDLNI